MDSGEGRHLPGVQVYWQSVIVSLPLAMSTPPNNERSPRKWFKQKFRSVFSSKSPSRNLDALPTSTNVPPINDSFLEAQTRENSPSDADRTGSGE